MSCLFIVCYFTLLFLSLRRFTQRAFKSSGGWPSSEGWPTFFALCALSETMQSLEDDAIRRTFPSDEDREHFGRLASKIADECQRCIQQPLWSIVNVLSNTTTEHLDQLAELYETACGVSSVAIPGAACGAPFRNSLWRFSGESSGPKLQRAHENGTFACN